MKSSSLLVILPFIFGSLNSRAQNIWVQEADFGGGIRKDAFGFSIGNVGYLGSGVNYTEGKLDFWKYDPSSNVWTQESDFPNERRYAVGFSIGNYGYAGTGTGVTGAINDFWQYDPAANTWAKKANFPGDPRYQAVGFSIGNKGYLGSGFTDGGKYKKDFFKYDPSTNKWTEIASLTKGRKEAVAFSIGGKGYITTGIIFTTGASKEIWEYDTTANTWTEKTPCPGPGRIAAAGFATNGKGYVTGGFDDGSGTTVVYNDTWEYDPTTDSWSEKADFPGTPRFSAVGFAIGVNGYVGTGEVSYTEFIQDFWQYSPASSCSAPTGQSSTNIMSTKATLNWDAVSGAIKYQVKYKASNSSTWTQTNSMSTTKTIMGLSANTSYTWQVRSVCSTNPTVTSDWSAKQHFTTTLRLSAEEDASNALDVYPNPFSTTAVISFSLSENSHTVIELYDLSGKKISTVLDENLDAGDHSIELNRNQLADGIYLVQLKTDDQVSTMKIMLQ